MFRPIRLLRYGVAVVSVALAIVLTLLLQPLLTPTVLPFFFLAVTFSTWYGGRGAGFVATILSVLASRYFLLPPLYSFLPIPGATIVELVVFSLVTLLISMLEIDLRGVQRRSRKHLLDLEQTEATLQESNARFQAAAEGSFDAIYIFKSVRDPAGELIDFQFVDLNEHAAKLISSTKADVLGQNLCELLPINRTQGFFEKYKQVVETGIPLMEEFSSQAMPGVTASWLHHQVVPIKDGIAITTRDITERKQAEAALQASEALYRTLAEAMPQLVWTQDTTGKVDYANQQWQHALGVTLEEVDRNGWEPLVHPDDLPKLLARQATSMQDSEVREAEFRYRMADGRYRWFLGRCVPVKNDRGQVVKWVGTSTDIDDLKRFEKERDRLLQLERAARAEAEAANRVKDEFLMVLSHELRTPLNPILGWTKLLQTRQFTSEARNHALETIERNARQQAQLVEDMLDVSRILQGKLTLNCCPVNLIEVIEGAIASVQLSAQAKLIAITTHLDATVPLVLGSQERLQQIVWNLLSNAIKFTPHAGQVDVYLESVGKFAQVRVIDTGKGIEASFIPYVFDYFRQADSTTTRPFGGLGLGLAISRHLVELHGGTIEAASEGLGKGAVFTIRLPIPLEEPVAVANASTLATPEAILQGKRILLVGDADDIQELMVIVLEQAGAEVASVISTEAVLEELARSQPDLLIGTIAILRKHDYELAERLRLWSQEFGEEIPVVALASYGDEIDPQEALANGLQQVLPTSIEPDELVETITRLILPKY